MYQIRHTQVFKKKESNTGSAFAAFLGEEGLFGDTQTVAFKRVIAWQLDPKNPSVTLRTLHGSAWP